MLLSTVRARLTTTAAIALIAAGLGVTSVDSIEAAPPSGAPVLHELGETLRFVDALSDNGRYAIILGDSMQGEFHVDLVTDTVTRVETLGSIPLDDGRTVIGRLGADGEVDRRVDIFTGEIRPQDLVAPSRELIAHLDAWPMTDPEPIRVLSTSPDGRYQIVRGSTAAGRGVRVWIYDTVDDLLVTPFEDGLDASDSLSVSGPRFFGGSGEVRYGTFSEGASYDYVAFDVLTGERRTVIEQPGGSARLSDVSDDYRWHLFTSRAPALGVAPGEGEVTFRQDVATGTIERAGEGLYRSIEIFDGGHILYEGVVDDVDGVFSWSGPETTTLISQPVPGEPGPGSVRNAEWSADGSVVAYTSYYDDVPERRLYSVGSIPSQVLSDGTVCADAAGARAGDFVGVNVTPVRAEAMGFGTLHSSGVAAGSTSNVNFRPGSVDPNVAFVEVGSDGRICFTNSVDGAVDVIIDQLLVASSSVFTVPTDGGAVRLLDTRASGRVGASGSVCADATGADPGDFVGVNVTPVRADAVGFATLHSSGVPAGSTSNVNFRPGLVDPNVAFVEVGSDGRVCFTNSEHGDVDVILDQLVVAPGSTFTLPGDGAVRLLDTRSRRSVDVGGSVCRSVVAAAPGDFVGVNVTPVRAAAIGFGTLHSSDVPAGSTSNVNFGPGSVDPNVAFVEVGSDGEICFTNSEAGAVDVILDQLVVASGSVFSLPSDGGAVRLLDTR